MLAVFALNLGISLARSAEDRTASEVPKMDGGSERWFSHPDDPIKLLGRYG